LITIGPIDNQKKGGNLVLGTTYGMKGADF